MDCKSYMDHYRKVKQEHKDNFIMDLRKKRSNVVIKRSYNKGDLFFLCCVPPCIAVLLICSLTPPHPVWTPLYIFFAYFGWKLAMLTGREMEEWHFHSWHYTDIQKALEAELSLETLSTTMSGITNKLNQLAKFKDGLSTCDLLNFNALCVLNNAEEVIPQMPEGQYKEMVLFQLAINRFVGDKLEDE